jgi:hypothetical protein
MKKALIYDKTKGQKTGVIFVGHLESYKKLISMEFDDIENDELRADELTLEQREDIKKALKSEDIREVFDLMKKNNLDVFYESYVEDMEILTDESLVEEIENNLTFGELAHQIRAEKKVALYSIIEGENIMYSSKIIDNCLLMGSGKDFDKNYVEFNKSFELILNTRDIMQKQANFDYSSLKRFEKMMYDLNSISNPVDIEGAKYYLFEFEEKNIKILILAR